MARMGKLGMALQNATLTPAQQREAAYPNPLIPGNIDLRNRPIVRNPDGSVSTVRSMSFGTDQGETLVPTISNDGRSMSDNQAMANFQQTGQHLGIFPNVSEANSYADLLHRDQANYAKMQGMQSPGYTPMDEQGTNVGLPPEGFPPQFGMPHVKPNFGDPGGTGDKLATLGQYMMAYAGVPLGEHLLQNAEQTRREQTALERGEQQYQRQRRDGMQDWQQKQEWERTHPNLTETERLLAGAGIKQGTPEYGDAIRSKLFPPMPVQGFDAQGNPTITFVPRNGQAPTPAAPVGKLTPMPGGPTPQASGGFR